MQKSSSDNNSFYHGPRPAPMTLEAWGVVIVFLGLCLEGFMKLWIEERLQLGGAFWTAFVPIKLYPSEVLFYTFGMIVVGYTCATYSQQLRSNAWLKIVALLLLIGVCSALHGYLVRSEFRMLAFSAFKASYFRLCFLPWFFMVFTRIPLISVADRIFWGSSLLALVSIAGTVQMAELHFSNEEAPNFTGSQLLLLPALYGFYKSCARRQIGVIANTLLLFAGVLLPLQKPALATAATAILVAVLGMAYVMQSNFIARRRISFAASAMIAIFTIAALFSGITLWIVASDGAGLSYIEERFLKTNYTGFDRDLSSGRVEIWMWALKEFVSSPIWGNGLGNYYEVLSSRTGATIRSTHNEYLEILQSGGLIAIIPYVWLIGLTIRAQLKILRHAPPAMVAVAGAIFSWFMAMALSNNYGNVTSVQSASFVFWAMVAATFALKGKLMTDPTFSRGPK